MRLLCFYILLLLCSCGQTNNTTVLTDNEIAGDVLAPPTSDTLVQYVFKNGLKGNQLLKINPNIEFSSGDTNGVSFYKYRFEYEGLS